MTFVDISKPIIDIMAISFDERALRYEGRGSIGMLLLPNFNGMAVHAFIDPFRAANYLSRRHAYSWQFLSLDGGTVHASNGFCVSGTTAFEDADPGHDLIAVNASWTPEAFSQRRILDWLCRRAGQGRTLCGIDTGAFVLAYAGLLDGYRTTVHYEHLAAFRELFPDIEAEETLFVVDRDRLSCAGGIAAADMALEMVRLQLGTDLANASARYIFQERLRSSSERQLSPKHEPIGYTVPEKLRDAILMMEGNIERPLRLGEMSSRLGLSQRQIERLFRRHAGMTAVSYYLNVRLDQARGLVTQTQMPVAQIAYACGFGNAAHFSRVYRRRFRLAPVHDRIQGRIPFQFRSFPGYALV